MLSSALLNRTSFGFSAENPMGERNGGSRGKDCEKLRPCIQIRPQEEVVLCDTDGPGMLTHLWFTGYVGHSFILRIYWDGMEAPFPHFLDAHMMRILQTGMEITRC